MKLEYPKWLYHKTEPAKIVQNKEEHESLGKGWEETPAVFAKESDETPEKSPADKGESEQGKAPIKEKDFTKMSVKELKAYLLEKGVAEESLKKANKDELIVMVGNL